MRGKLIRGAGAVGGFVVALALVVFVLRTWPELERVRRMMTLAAIVTLAGGAFGYQLAARFAPPSSG